MAHGLVSTGVSFPDGTTQTTASLYPLTSGIQQTVAAATTTTIDLSLGTFVKLTHGANITTLNFTNVPSGRAVLVKLLRQKDNTHTARTIAWQSSWRMNAGQGWSSYSDLGARQTEMYSGTPPGDNRYRPISNVNVQTAMVGTISALGKPGNFLNVEIDNTGATNFGITLIQSPDAAEMLEFLTLDGGTTWRVLGREWYTTADRTEQDIFIFGYPDGSARGEPLWVGDGYGTNTLTSASIQASYIDWVPGTNQIARGQGQPLPYYNPWDRRPWTSGVYTWTITDYSTNNAWHRYQEWKNLGLFGVYPVQIVNGPHAATWLSNTGHVFCSGSNGHAGLGRNYTQDTFSERFVTLTSPLLSPVTQITSGRHGASVIVSGNQLWTWGYNAQGQRAQNLTSWGISSPVQITSAVSTWSQVAEGYEFVVAVKANGTLWHWGRGGEGQSGTGAAVSRSSPVQIGAATNWVRVQAGHLFAAALNSSGQLYTWGHNDHGQLGILNTLNQSAPNLALSGVAQTVDSFSCGMQWMMALKTDGTMWAWGRGGYGGLGHYPEGLGLVNRSSPVQIGTLNTWSKVYAHGLNTGYAIKTDGTLWGWGHNDQWQLCLLSANYGGVVGMPYREETTHRKSSPIQLGSSTKWQRLFVSYDDSANLGGRVMIGFANTAVVPSGQTTIL
jgi:alpha-tubulin suppressor-like RCC1 family protein